MGRKEGQRTKGNTKPSSSARSAELLSNVSGSTAATVSDFSSAVFGLNPLTADEEALLPGELKMAMRKLTKKDVTTKLKALQEFCDMCDTEEGSEHEAKTSDGGMKVVLPYWPRLYSRLAFDQDQRVREAAQRAHLIVVKRLGRELAPYLKSIASSWLLSCGDPHAPAAALATEAFRSAFPEESKRRDAILYCQTEILTAISDNLLQQTPSTMSKESQNSSSEEVDVESKYTRVVVCTLNGYAAFVDLAFPSKEAVEKGKHFHTLILTNSKFWKLAHHNNIMVRLSWYLLAASLCKNWNSLADIWEGKHQDKMVANVMGKLDETDPLVGHNIWEAAMYLTNYHRTWHKHIDVEKVVVPKILSRLSNGFSGNVGIYTSLLPLLSRLPAIVEEADDFYSRLLSAIRSGINTSPTSQQRSLSKNTNSLKMATDAFYDCALYGLKHSGAKPAFFQLTYWLRDCLADEKTGLEEAQLVFGLTGRLINQLGSTRRSKEDQQQEQQLWSIVEELTSQTGPCYRLYLFMYCLSSKPLKKTKTTTKAVKFGNSADLQYIEEQAFPLIQDIQQRLADIVAFKSTEVSKNLLQDTLGNPLKKATLAFLTFVFGSFGSEGLYGSVRSDGEFEGLLDLLVSEKVLGLCCDVMSLHVALVVSILRRKEEDNRRPFYDSISGLEDTEWISALVGGLLSDEGFLDEGVERLVAGEAFAAKLIKVADLVRANQDTNSWQLLITAAKYGDLMELSNMDKILCQLATAVESPDSTTSQEQLIFGLIASLDCACKPWGTLGARRLITAILISSAERKQISPGLVKSWEIAMPHLFESSTRHDFCDMFIQATKLFATKVASNGNNSSVLAHLASLLIRGTGNNEALCLDVFRQLFPIRGHRGCFKTASVLLTSNQGLHLYCPKDDGYLDHNSRQPEKEKVPTDFIFQLFENINDILEREENVAEEVMPILANALVAQIQLQQEPIHSESLFSCVKRLGEKTQHKLGICVLKTSRKMGFEWAAALNYLLSNRDFEGFKDNLSLAEDLPSFEGSNDELESLSHGSNLEGFQGFLEPDHLLSSNYNGNLHTFQVKLAHCDNMEVLNDLWSSEVGKILSLEQEKDDDNSTTTGSFNIMTCCFKGLLVKAHLSDALKALIQVLGNWRQSKEDAFLFSCDISDKSWEDVMFVAATCDILNCAVEQHKADRVVLEPQHWDLILCALSSWVQTVQESRHILVMRKSDENTSEGKDGTKTTVLFQSICNLTSTVGEYLENLGKTDQEEKKKKNASLLEEWEEFFAAPIYTTLLGLFVDLTIDRVEQPEADHVLENLLCSLGNALRCVPLQQLLDHNLPAKFLASDVDAAEAQLPDNLVFLLNHLAPMVQSRARPVQTTSYHLLKRAMGSVLESEELRKEELRTMVDSGAEFAEESRELPRRLTEILARNEPVLTTLFTSLGGLEFGEPIPAPFPADSAAYNACTSFLLAWKLILALVSNASAELRPKYSEYLRKHNHVQPLMQTLFHMMTMQVKLSGLDGSFGSDPMLTCLGDFEAISSGLEMRNLACSVYHSLLKHLPALVRNWWNLTDKRTSSIVEKFTCAQVTPSLWTEEVERVNQTKASFNNMTIKVRPTVREVVAIYTLDEGSMELVVQLPSNFPLGPVSVESGKRVGVTTAQWRTWMLQLTTFLQHQNGSLVDGLTVWKHNVDKRFEGVEECYICFYILHGSNHQLPKVACPTCKKKFHSACLYKWFSTSNNSTCPLCRNLF